MKSFAIISFLLFILCLSFFGCSPGSQTPTTPNPLDENISDFPQDDESDYNEMAFGTMNLEKALKEYLERENK